MLSAHLSVLSAFPLPLLEGLAVNGANVSVENYCDMGRRRRKAHTPRLYNKRYRCAARSLAAAAVNI